MRFKFRDIVFLISWGNEIYNAWKYGGVREELAKCRDGNPVLANFWNLVQSGINRIENRKKR